jgi:hypothetical protein
MTRLLALPAPALFTLNKSIRVPRVAACAEMLTFWTGKCAGYCYDQRQLDSNIAKARQALDFAEWIAGYTATHDCNPRILAKGVDTSRGSRTATVQVEDSIYRVQVAVGRRARGMYGTSGNHWHLYVAREGADRRLVEGERCGKSEGLGAAAVRQHLAWKFRLQRGLKPARK